MKGIFAALAGKGGAPKGAPSMPTEPAESPADDEAGETSLDEYADIAFDALKNDDRAAFVEAFKGALRCGPE